MQSNPSEVFGLWAIWQPPGAVSITTLVQQGLSSGGGFGKPVAYYDDAKVTMAGPDYRVANGTAILELIGPLMKYDAYWFGGTSTIEIREQLAAALNDPNVTNIVLLIDSPGGTVSGTKDLADDVAKAAQVKPVYAYLQDCCCSAAYWIASQATKVFANEACIAGSIGVFTTLYDYSAAFEADGIKVQLVKAGEFKGTGTAGTPITPEQVAEIQTIIDAQASQFVRGIAQGRRMALKRMQAMADGRAHIAETALGMGLIDGIQSFDDTVTQVSKARASKRGAKAMWNEETGAFDERQEIIASDDSLAVTVITSEECIDNTPADVTASDNQTEIIEMSETAQETQATEPVVAPVTPPVATAPAVASLAQLKDACPGASADFLVAQMEANATVEAGAKAWMAKMTADLAAAAAELTTLKSKAEKAADKTPGVETLGDKSTGAVDTSSDPIAAFETLKTEYLAKFPNDPARAMKELNATHGAAREAYLAAYTAANPYKPRTR